MRTSKDMEAIVFDSHNLRREARTCTRLAHMQVVAAKRDALLTIRRDCLRLARYLDDAKGVRPLRGRGVAPRVHHATAHAA